MHVVWSGQEKVLYLHSQDNPCKSGNYLDVCAYIYLGRSHGSAYIYWLADIDGQIGAKK